MSMAAYALAARDAIQAAMPAPWNDAKSVEVGLDGMPKPDAGEWYVAVHPGPWTAEGTGDYDLMESMTLQVTLTRRLNFSPQDRWGPEVWTKANGLDATARKLIPVLHYNYDTMAVANKNIDGGDDLFHHPFLFLSASPPTLKDFSWFSAGLPDLNERQTAQTGLAMTMTFGRAQRMQRADLVG